MMFLEAISVLAALGSPAVQSAQDRPVAVDDVVVEGVRRTDRTAFDFVRSVSAPPMGSHTLAVWDTPICVSVDNLDPDAASGVQNRILGRAESLGVEVGGPDCKPNVIVIFTADGQATAENLLRNNRAAFQPTTGPTQPDRASLRRFTDENIPVRWWSVSMPVDLETGNRVVEVQGEHIFVQHNQTSGSVTGRNRGVSQTGGPPWRRLLPGMKPRNDGVRDILQITFVVVDASLAEGSSLGALGDYIAMVTLAQVDPRADTQHQPTILNLFSQTPPPGGLTQWDRDYLAALYDARVDHSVMRFQQEEIARRMVDDASGREP